MNLEFLEQIFDDKSTEYYVVEKWEKACLVRVPTSIIYKRCTPAIDLYIKDQTLESVKSMLRTPIDCNAIINGDYAPFQLGMTVGCIEKFHKVECSISGFLKEIAKKENQNLKDFWAYRTLIQDIKTRETPKTKTT